MFLNRWKPYPKRKPKKQDQYLCTIRYGDDPGQAEVYGYDNETRKNDKRIYTNRLVYRDDVVAFKKLPKIYK